MIEKGLPVGSLTLACAALLGLQRSGSVDDLFEVDPADVPWTGDIAELTFFGAVRPTEGGAAREAQVTSRYVLFKDGQEIAQTDPKPLLAGEGQAVATDEDPLASSPPGEHRIAVELLDAESAESIQTSVRFRFER